MSFSKSPQQKLSHGVLAPDDMAALLRVVIPYVVFSAVWILLSDRVLEWWVNDAAQLTTWQTYKGWLFVAVSTLFVAWLMAGVLRSQRRLLDNLAASEQRVQKLNRANLVLSEINQTIVRVRDPEAFLTRACEIAVDLGGFRMAWVGLVDPATKAVKPVAHAGIVDGYLDRLNIVLGDTPTGRGPSATALNTGQHVVVDSVKDDPRMAPWRENALQRGYQSLVAFPLSSGGKVRGVITLYAAEPARFDVEELSVFDEMALNVAFALEVAEQDERLQHYAAELEERVQQRTVELKAATEKAQTADRLKSTFLATMSHELRTPLNSIIGFTSVLSQELAGPLNDEQKKQLGMVQASARHLLALINDVLDISKIEAGQIELIAAPFDMHETIEAVLRGVLPMAQKKGIELTASFGPAVGKVVSDRRRVEQILLNLLSNAVKFTDQGQVEIHTSFDAGQLRVRVRDTGIGIKAEDLNRLFRPFQQLDGSLARRHEGTGLGLSICANLARLLGGEVTVESEWGVGSTFTLKLPLQPHAAEADRERNASTWRPSL